MVKIFRPEAVKDADGNVTGYTEKTYATYTYDAWGKLIGITNSAGTSIINKQTTSTSLANLNPLRYRGYYYDNETGFYYLQSRYYDPTVRRFVNADMYTSTDSSSAIACNMFAYCANNPVNLVDYAGTLFEWVTDYIAWFNENVVTPTAKFVGGVIEDCKNFDLSNKSEEKVLESNYFSYYKGVPVFRINGNRSGTVGAIFLTRESNNRQNPEDVVRHEYGHSIQLGELGLLNFLICVGIPSWQEWGSKDYYDKPWELTADIYGGVQSRTHSASDIAEGIAYMHRSKTAGALAWLLIN